MTDEKWRISVRMSWKTTHKGTGDLISALYHSNAFDISKYKYSKYN